MCQAEAQRGRDTRRAVADKVVKRALEKLDNDQKATGTANATSADAAGAEELADAGVAQARQQACLVQQRLLLSISISYRAAAPPAKYEDGRKEDSGRVMVRITVYSS